MIVRSRDDGWLLLRQMDHARLSAELAKSMALPPFDRLGCREALIEAIACHDDGWADWDSEWSIDPNLQRPRNFTEVEPLDVYAIWQTGVELAAARSALAGWAVAGHFLRLAKIGGSDEAGRKWLQWAEERRLVCLAQWLGEGPDRDIAIAENAVDWLRFFDSFSLNLCRGRGCEPFALKAPTGSEWTMAWRSPDTVEIAPWTFDAAALAFDLPVRPFPDNRIGPTRLNWRLVPGGPVRSERISFD